MSRSFLIIAVIVALVSFASAASVTIFTDNMCASVNPDGGATRYVSANTCLEIEGSKATVTCSPTLVALSIYGPVANCDGAALGYGSRNATATTAATCFPFVASGTVQGYAKIDCDASSASTVAISSMLLAFLAFAANKVASL